MLLAVALMGGVYNLWGAVIAALLMQFLPAFLQNLGLSYAWLDILFGIGVLLTLTTAPAGIADQFPKDMKRLGGVIWRHLRRPTAAPSAATAAPPAATGGTT